ncbi:MAG: hypothetical protein MHM6MM_007206 [Cercozoa sp. M6MM]
MKLLLASALVASAVAASCSSHSIAYIPSVSEVTVRYGLIGCVQDIGGGSQECAGAIYLQGSSPVLSCFDVTSTSCPSSKADVANYPNAYIPARTKIIHAVCGKRTALAPALSNTCQPMDTNMAGYDSPVGGITYSGVPTSGDFMWDCLAHCASRFSIDTYEVARGHVHVSSDIGSSSVYCQCTTVADTNNNQVSGSCSPQTCPIASGQYYSPQCGNGLGAFPWTQNHRDSVIYVNSMAIVS